MMTLGSELLFCVYLLLGCLKQVLTDVKGWKTAVRMTTLANASRELIFFASYLF